MKKKIGQKDSVKKNYAFILLYQLFNVIAPLVTTPYISRVLGAENIGVYSYTFAIASYFGIFGVLGVNTYGQLMISQNRYDIEERSRCFWGISLCKLLTMVISTSVYVVMLLYFKEYRLMYELMFIFLVAQLIDVTWFYQGLENFKSITIRNVLVKLISIILVFLCVKKKTDLYIYTIVIQGGTLLGNGLLWFRIPRYIKFVRICELPISKYFKENLVYFIPSVAAMVFCSLDKCMIGWITQSSYECGYYEQTTKVYNLLVVIVTSLTVAVLPRINYLWKNSKDDKVIRNMVDKTTRFIVAVACPLGIGLFSISKFFVPLYYGEGYEPCVVLLRVFSVILILTSMNSIVSNQCLVAVGKQNTLNKSLIFSTLINVCLNAMLIPFYKSYGAAVASCVSELVLLCMIAYYSRNILQIRNLVNHLVKYFVGSLIMGINLCIINNILSIQSNLIMVCIDVVFGIIIYSIYLIMTKDYLIKEAIEIFK